MDVLGSDVRTVTDGFRTRLRHERCCRHAVEAQMLPHLFNAENARFTAVEYKRRSAGSSQKKGGAEPRGPAADHHRIDYIIHNLGLRYPCDFHDTDTIGNISRYSTQQKLRKRFVQNERSGCAFFAENLKDDAFSPR